MIRHDVIHKGKQDLQQHQRGLHRACPHNSAGCMREELVGSTCRVPQSPKRRPNSIYSFSFRFPQIPSITKAKMKPLYVHPPRKAAIAHACWFVSFPPTPTHLHPPSPSGPSKYPLPCVRQALPVVVVAPAALPPQTPETPRPTRLLFRFVSFLQHPWVPLLLLHRFLLRGRPGLRCHRHCNPGSRTKSRGGKSIRGVVSLVGEHLWSLYVRICFLTILEHLSHFWGWKAPHAFTTLPLLQNTRNFRHKNSTVMSC